MAGRKSRHAQCCPLKGVVTSETTTQEPVSVCLCWDVGSQETELCIPAQEWDLTQGSFRGQCPGRYGPVQLNPKLWLREQLQELGLPGCQTCKTLDGRHGSARSGEQHSPCPRHPGCLARPLSPLPSEGSTSPEVGPPTVPAP